MAERVIGLLGQGVVPAQGTALFADDLGFTRGDGCFETTRVVTDQAGSRIDHLSANLDRLDRSLAGLGLPPADRPAWTDLIDAVLASWTVPGEAMLKLMVTRGRESNPGQLTGLVMLTPIAPLVLQQRADGVAVVTLARGTTSNAYADAPWLLGGVKTLSYAVNVAALREAAARGADDVLFLSSDGYVLEAPTATAIWLADGVLHTTPTGGTGVLASITQQTLFAAAEANDISTAYSLATPAQLRASDGVWLVSSGRGVAEVHTLDGHPLASTPGLTEQLLTFAGF